MMSNNYPVQFKFGVAGIISSLIWICVKFGLFSISNYEWISLSGIIFSFSLFYHYYETGENFSSFISVFMFFLFITFFVYFNQIKLKNTHTNFDFSFFSYVFFISLGAYFFVKSFVEVQKFKFILVAFIFLIGSFLNFVFYSDFNRWNQDLFNSFALNKIENGVITLLLILLLFFPLKNIFMTIKQKMRNDVSVS